MNNVINILLIEDNPGDARLVQEVLREVNTPVIRLIIAENMAKGLKSIAAENIHVILLDLNLPDSKGLDTFRKIHKFALGLPIIIMSVLTDRETIYEALKLGAQDYLIKGRLEPESLIRAVRYASWTYHAAD